MQEASQNSQHIHNPIFQDYKNIYDKIYDNFRQQIESYGVPFASPAQERLLAKVVSLKDLGATLRNDNKSIFVNWISPACKACQKGEGSASFYLSLKCHRQCYYCFNPNQENYHEHLLKDRDCLSELEHTVRQGHKPSFIALTGGEPLLRRKESLEFLRYAKEKLSRVHTRLYTSGDLLTKDYLVELHKVRLDEIRISIKLEDEEELQQKVLGVIRQSKDYIPFVMVEMPVIPGSLEKMKVLLHELDEIGISGINLLEFCFPLYNAQEFIKRGFKLKDPPFRVLYNYWYAGGLPVVGSEEECLDLLHYTLDQNLKLGVHYCSLENKYSGQVFQQNRQIWVDKIYYFSEKDYFLKSAKVFGDDVRKVLKILKDKKKINYRINEEYQYLEFDIRDIRFLKGFPIEVGISTNIVEERFDGNYLRELKIERVTPEVFNLQMF